MNLKALWLDLLYPLLCVFAPCLIYQRAHLKSAAAKNSKRNISYFFWSYTFILYLFMALYAAGIGSIWDIGRFGSIIRTNEIYLVPFQSEGMMTYLLNILMFMPLGFLLPLLGERYASFGRTVAAGAGFSLMIEMGQLFNRRATDIDDLLMNILGTAVGYLIWLIFSRLPFMRSKKTQVFHSQEAFAYLILSVLGTFLLFNVWFFLKLFYQ